ncbi:hypothetical protein ABH935_008582 [Catenulispora sp. GAS73]|uniref:multiubiquitin domain-containing protein n=1 Tax=Catenulispora sp. GAS73 TaxID=3156269 RepID=UPI00351253DF
MYSAGARSVIDSEGRGHAPEAQVKQKTIYVNTRAVQIEGHEISFERLVELAYPGSHGDEVTFTISYTDGPEGHESGSLTPHHSVEVKNGMIFDVIRTVRS